MRLGWLVLVLVLVIASMAAPAAAAPQPQVSDRCGDATTNAGLNDQGADVEENRPYLDVAAGTVAPLRNPAGTVVGVTASVTLCGQPDADQGGYAIGWDYGDTCYGDVAWALPVRDTRDGTGAHGALSIADGATATLSETCYHQTESPLDSGVETVYRHTLPAEAVHFEGKTVSFDLLRADLPAAAAPRFSAGTRLDDIHAVTMDQGPSLWAGYGDTEGNRGHAFVRSDFALDGGAFVVPPKS